MTDVSVIPVHLLSSLFCTSGLLPPSFRSLRVQLSEKSGVQVALRFGGERSMSWALNLLCQVLLIPSRAVFAAIGRRTRGSSRF